MIDVHDLPEPVAKAIAAMVQSLRDASSVNSGSLSGASIGETLTPILQEAWALKRGRPSPFLRGQESETQQMIVEKFKRQGLQL